MHAAASTIKSSLARLCRWLYVRAITLVVALVMLVCYVVGQPAKAEADSATAARSATAVMPHVAVARGTALASAAKPLVLGSGQFGGLTSKGWPVVLRVSRRGDRVRQAVAGVEFTCTSGGGFAVHDMWKDLPISKRRFRATSADSDAEAGLVYHYTDTISGRMNRRGTRIAGTWRNVIVQRNAFGAVLDTCDTGPLRFTARR